MHISNMMVDVLDKLYFQIVTQVSTDFVVSEATLLLRNTQHDFQFSTHIAIIVYSSEFEPFVPKKKIQLVHDCENNL